MPAEPARGAPAGSAAAEGAPAGGQPPRAPRTFRGRPVPPGMVLPSRTQYHGTIMGMIAIGIVLVLTLGVFLNSGVGPFAISNLRVVPESPPVATGTVINRGDHAGPARCVATWQTPQGGLQETLTVTTEPIAPGSSRSVRITLPFATTGAERVAISCK